MATSTACLLGCEDIQVVGEAAESSPGDLTANAIHLQGLS